MEEERGKRGGGGGERERKTAKCASVPSAGSLIPWFSRSGQREAGEAMVKTGPASTCSGAGVTGTCHTDAAAGTPEKNSHTRWLCSLTSIDCEEAWRELANS